MEPALSLLRGSPQKSTHVGADSLCERRHRVEGKIVQAVLDLRDVVLPDSGQLFHRSLSKLRLQPRLSEVGAEQCAQILPCVIRPLGWISHLFGRHRDFDLPSMTAAQDIRNDSLNVRVTVVC